MVGPRVKMFVLSRPDSLAQILDPKGVEEKFGVPPERIVDYLALMGDASDNVPGIRGVGEKTAAELVKRFGTAEEVLARAGEIEREKLRSAVKEHAGAVRLAKKLVTLDTNLPDLPTIDELHVHKIDATALRKLFEELQFNNLIQTLPAEPRGVTESGRDYRCVRDAAAFEEMLKELGAAKRISVDTETTGLDAMRAKAVGISLSCAPRAAFYVPLLADPRPPRRRGRDRGAPQAAPREPKNRESRAECQV